MQIIGYINVHIHVWKEFPGATDLSEHDDITPKV
jgi:hypothetical protein